MNLKSEKRRLGYDIHVATESGDSEGLKSGLAALGFNDDNLAQQGLTFDPETAQFYQSCPLILVHASRKVPERPELREIEVAVHELMVQTGSVGYWHSEFIPADDHFEPETEFDLKPLPFERLASRPRSEEKIWDIHLSFRERLMPKGLGDMLLQNGIYYLARNKRVPEGGEDRFAVYTVQGVSSFKEGERFYAELCAWLRSVGAPPCDIKLELTTAMRLYGEPQAVPPTVSEIVWK